MARTHRARIERIRVEKLFGFLSYDITPQSHDDLIILYGDNGCGKTTILNLVFHALAPRQGRGHRTFLARTPFEELEIVLADGDRVYVSRADASERALTMTLERRGLPSISYRFLVRQDGRVTDRDNPDHIPLIEALGDLNLGLFMLPDSRRIRVDGSLTGQESRYSPQHEDDELLRKGKSQPGIDTAVRGALRRAEQWIRGQALAASGRGETDTNRIYTDILRSIVRLNQTDGTPDRIGLDGLRNKVHALRDRSCVFNQFGLAPVFATSELEGVLKEATESQTDVIEQVLSPYIRSVEARLDALDKIREALETFSGVFSRFYVNKTLNFRVRAGFEVISEYPQEPMNPANLSSGEKQLLLLFCNVLLAGSRPSIFIIDEPELSLNVKWQRELISSLLACVKGTDVQFLFATHSLEMLALHQESVVRLVSKEWT